MSDHNSSRSETSDRAAASSTAQDTLKSPEVLPDKRVTFRIFAPKASEVIIDGEWILQGIGTGGPMQRDNQGVWSITVGPLQPTYAAISPARHPLRSLTRYRLLWEGTEFQAGASPPQGKWILR